MPRSSINEKRLPSGVPTTAANESTDPEQSRGGQGDARSIAAALRYDALILRRGKEPADDGAVDPNG